MFNKNRIIGNNRRDSLVSITIMNNVWLYDGPWQLNINKNRSDNVPQRNHLTYVVETLTSRNWFPQIPFIKTGLEFFNWLKLD